MIIFRITENTDGQINLYAKDLDETYSFNLNDTLQPVEQMWVNFFLGVLQQLKDRDFAMAGFNIVFMHQIYDFVTYIIFIHRRIMKETNNLCAARCFQ